MDKVLLYPNPSYGSLTIEMVEPELISIEVFNASGQRVLVQKANMSYKEVLDLSELQSGTYRIRVEHEHNTVNFPFVLLK